MKHRFFRHIALILLAVAGCISARAQVNAEQMIRVGQNALYFEDYVLSIQYFNQAITAKPYLAQPYFLRAIAKINLDDYLGAEEDAAEAIERNPFIADAYEVRGVARQNRGELRLAIDDYNHALLLLPRNRQLMFNKALAQQGVGDADSARITFDQLLADFPGFENGYVGRARLRLEHKDTVGAIADIDKALEINKNLANGYLLRADIAINGRKDYQAGVKDMDEAIRLLPREAGLYINRAFLRYNLDDYDGAMADYDYAIQLDPLNAAAIYNRGLLRMEVRDNDNAIRDFNSALDLDPEDYRSLYNRAYLYTEKRDYNKALADVDRLVERFPDLPEALYMRSNIFRSLGRMGQAEADYKKALAMSKNLKGEVIDPRKPRQPQDEKTEKAENKAEDKPSNEEIAKRFKALRTVRADINIEGEYNNRSIRGKVQDRGRRIELEPIFALSYYIQPTELSPSTYYIQEIDEINATRMLRFLVQLTNDDITLDNEELIKRHFESIDYYNSYLATHEPRAIDYFGRAMDFMTLRNYPAAIADLNKAIELTPEFSAAYFERAVARIRNLLTDAPADATTRQAELKAIVADYDKVISLSPRNPFAYFNKGNLLADLGDYTSALMAFNKAIEIKPDFGEAYYNRGYVYFQLGNHDRGVENLSKAGELGVVPSYSLMKKMSH